MKRNKTGNTNNCKFCILSSIRNPQSAPRNCEAISGTESRKSYGFHGAFCNGFSFMELMVVVAIISILIIASMPLFRNFTRGSNLNNGRAMVVSALRKTRGAAITYNKNYMVLINADTDIIHQSGGDFDLVGNAVKIYNRQDGTIDKWEQLPQGVKFDARYSKWTLTRTEYVPYPNDGDPGDTVLAVEFKPTGGTMNNSFTITLKDENTSDTKIIIVNNLTGRIKVE